MPLTRSVIFILYFVSLLLTSLSFCRSLECSTLFRSLPFTSAFGTILPKNVPDYSSSCDVLLTYYIRFKNFHCCYINLIDLKYSISSLKAFGSSCCHYSQKIDYCNNIQYLHFKYESNWASFSFNICVYIQQYWAIFTITNYCQYLHLVLMWQKEDNKHF